MEFLQHLLELVQSGEYKTRYSHEIEINSDNKIIATDCSGLVDFWLQNEYPAARAEVFNYVLQIRDIAKYQITRLYSFDFYDFFQYIQQNTSTYWQFVDVNNVLQPGDILAFINTDNKWRWGHVAVVVEEISRSKEKITLKIIDSSKHHHFEDWHQSEKMGIGCGIIELYLDNGAVSKVCYGPDCMRIRAVCAGRLLKK